MPIQIILLLPVLIATVGAVLLYRRAAAMRASSTEKVHSLPQFYAYLCALLVVVPGYIVMVAWLLLEPAALNAVIVSALPDSMTSGVETARLSLIISEVRQAAIGVTFGEPSPEVVAAAQEFTAASEMSRWLLPALILLLGLAAIYYVYGRVSARFRARNTAETVTRWLMIACAALAIAVTLGILLSLLFEGLRFFAVVPITEFLFGTNWDPQIAIRPDQVASSGAFGAVPIFVGTIVIAFTAMAVAFPVGLFAAIYMSEFAPRSVRSVAKPLIEILAGIPTIVYGFFAVLVVSPAIRGAGDAIGVTVSPTAAIVPGLVMGVMLIPFISSLSDDALRAVPRALRDGSLGLGANNAETVMKVILPAAIPGIVGGVLLATSRAIGETMIVVMAAGLTANLTANPLDGVTTVTVQIVSLLIGDTSFDNPKTLAAFGLGLSLFLGTLLLNLVALQIVKHYREQYD
ncbi:phosphate ABC transporter permease subunit PstC [Aurantimonas sp. 22II-16-19i]|uniref:phosphate ABC transporter permease subunit PstC n=1 Tax=Aurantimonas sp. 22II-16-19i TaxID=1317114 RepID=UPI0009F7E890|nr:phosphate ABC transporter permease subunit PstC [Aurantimonas sp. 22II-16-19i]ORE97622.1 phosphate ABC transporter permease [Aurantimonas sp. 22II-16-19i]